MATIEELDEARDMMIHRMAERVDALRDVGEDTVTLKEKFDRLQGEDRWAKVLVMSSDVTIGDIAAMATVLQTDSTWLMTGRHAAVAAPTTGETR